MFDKDKKEAKVDLMAWPVVEAEVRKLMFEIIKPVSEQCK